MRKLFFTITATALIWMAMANAVFACGFRWYEPEIPEELRNI